MSRVLAVDVGKSRCRAALVVDGVRLAEAEVAGPGGLAERTGPTDAADAVLAAARLVLDGPVEHVAIGLAGLTQAPGAPAALAVHLFEPLGARRLVAASDMTTSHLGALAGSAGVVLAAGTGSVALAVAPSGAHHRVDGWGYLLGDAGSGFDLGRRALAEALRCHDGRGGSERLRALAEQRYGSLDDLPRLVHGADNVPRTVAAFARDVAAAASDGDPVARALWTDAADRLAATAAAAADALPGVDPVPVATVGGLFDVGPLLAEPFAAALLRRVPGSRVTPPVGDAIDGAHLMATRDDLPHAPLMTCIERGTL